MNTITEKEYLPMRVHPDPFTVDMEKGSNCSVSILKDTNNITEYQFTLSWTAENAAADAGFTVSWEDRVDGLLYKWDSRCLLNRDIAPHWDDVFPSMLSCSSPVTCYFDGEGNNSYCWALSECRKLVHLKNGINDQFGNLTLQFSLRTRQFTNQYSTTLVLRIDKRPVSMRRAVEDTARWWEESCDLKPMAVPSSAFDPLYSFWYSYHQAVDETTVEERCRWAKKLGFDICIVDDGWHTDNNLGSYGYCGDWQSAPSKLPDMAAHVKRVHDMGMKYILWYSVPLMGHHSIHYAHFRNMLLRDAPDLTASVLDPRYKEVREFLIETFRKALLCWDLDGFKLDFIDIWHDHPSNAPYSGGMDIPALQDAVDACMTGIISELSKIKPDLLVEFRQHYIGPHMKRFGNMFRVGDCAGNYLKNRASILDLRMLMGNQAVHSDMLTLAPYEKPENNALQIISCMFGVLQYSCRMEEMTPELEEISVFWLNFLKKHRTLLLQGKLEAFEPHLLYTWAKSTLDNACAVGIYSIDRCVQPDAVDRIYIANGSAGNRILLELSGVYHIQILDCRGRERSCEERMLCGISVLPVPSGGLAILTRA